MSTADGVLVVGAGPVGLTTACQLARLGVPVRVVDALPAPTTESRAVTLHARSMEMLAALGVLPRLEARGRRIAALAMVDGRTGETRARVPFDEVPSRHPFLLDIPQPDTEAVLAERAAELGIVVERGVSLTALSQDDDGVDVTLRGPDGRADRRASAGSSAPTAATAPPAPSPARSSTAASTASTSRWPTSTSTRPVARHHPDVPPPRRHGDPLPARREPGPHHVLRRRPRRRCARPHPGADPGPRRRAHGRAGHRARPALADLLRGPPRPGPALPPRARPPRRRRRAHPQPRRRRRA